MRKTHLNILRKTAIAQKIRGKAIQAFPIISIRVLKLSTIKMLGPLGKAIIKNRIRTNINQKTLSIN